MARQIDVTIAIQGSIEGARNVEATFKSIESGAKKLGLAVTDAFGPKLTTSVDAFNRNMLNAGQVMEAYANQSRVVTGLTEEQKNALIRGSQAFQAQAISGGMNNKVLEEYLGLIQASSGGTRANNAVMAQSATAIQAQQVALVGLNNAQTGFMAGTGAMGTAGQAMVASFSIGQAAAGNFQQAIFGLGFSFMFLGKAMLQPQFVAFIAVFSAAQIILGKFTGQSREAAQVQEGAAAATASWSQAFEELAGTARLSADALIESIRSAQELGIPIDELLEKQRELVTEMSTAQLAETYGNMATRLTASNGEVVGSLNELIEKENELAAARREGIKQVASYIPVLSELIVILGQAAIAYETIVEGVSTFIGWLGGSKQAVSEYGEAQVATTAQIEEAAAAVANLTKEMGDLQIAYDKNITLQKQAAALQKGFNAETDAVKDEYEILLQDRKDSLDADLDAINNWARDATNARRTALSEEVRALREANEDWAVERNKALRADLKALRDAATEALGITQDRFEQERELAQGKYDITVSSRRKALSQEVDAIRDSAQDAVDARRDQFDQEKLVMSRALEDQVNIRRIALREENQAISQAATAAINAAQEAAAAQSAAAKAAADAQVAAVKKALKGETEAIKDLYDDLIDARKDALDDEVDNLRDVADDRIKEVKKAYKLELDANKDRINALKDQERDLKSELDDLVSRRLDLQRLQMSVISELSELEDLGSRVGFSDSLNREIALHKGKLNAIAAENEAIDEQTGVISDTILSIQDLIEEAEARTDQIKEQRDLAIEAIRDELDAARDAAKDRSEAEIDALKDTRDAEVELAKEAAAAKIAQIKEVLAEAQAAISAQTEAIRQAATDAKQAATDAADAQILEWKRQHEDKVIQMEEVRDADIDIITTVRDEAIAAAKEVEKEDLRIIKAVRDEAIAAAELRYETERGEITETRDLAMQSARDDAAEEIKVQRRLTTDLATEATTRSTNDIAAINATKTASISAAQETATEEIQGIKDRQTEALYLLGIQQDIKQALFDQAAFYESDILPLERERAAILAEIDKGITGAPEGAQEAILYHAGEAGISEDLLADVWTAGPGGGESATTFGASNLSFIAQTLGAMLEMFSGDTTKAVIATRFGASTVKAAEQQSETEGGNWRDYIPSEAQKYLAIFGFQRGGRVPGPLGAPRLIVAHGGEEVSSGGEPLKLDMNNLPPLAGLTKSGGSGTTVVNLTINAKSSIEMKRVERFINKTLGNKAVILSKMRNTARG